MKKPTRSILQELNNIHGSRDTDQLIDTTANNIIESSINLLNRIHSMYDEQTAADLEKRFINSIKNGDPDKFRRGHQKVIREQRRKGK